MLDWQTAWTQALYGPGGFSLRPEGPAGHFRTAAHAAPDELADALAELARRGGRTAVVDIGAGRGELLTALARLDGPRLHGVDLVERPAGLPPRVGWSRGIADLPPGALDNALIIAWELLDTVPCPVVEVDDHGEPRIVLVDPGSGAEEPGELPDDAQRRWLHRWWPLAGAEPGDRAEIGLPRDRLWTRLVRLARGTARGAELLAVDYAHLRATRPPRGSLAGYRAGRLVPPVPDGSCDVTAHVAIDAVAEAGTTAGATTAAWTDQASALIDLGLSRSPRASGGAELTDPAGLGGFAWLRQSVGR